VPADRVFNSTAFEKELVNFAGNEEYIIRGGRDKFGALKKAFAVRGDGAATRTCSSGEGAGW
jgi:hypothetical protein